MERIPQTAPLPCYGLERSMADPQCQTCPHTEGCRLHMGVRDGKVPLDKVKFKIAPACFDMEVLRAEDPELPHLQRLYCDCYASVFQRNPVDNVSLYRKQIIDNANKASCSVRMYLLANMVAHVVHERTVVGHTEKARAATFTAKLLAADFGVKRAQTYQQLCHDRFGTFNLTSLSVLADTDQKNTLADIMLNSEMVAACWLVRHRIFHSGESEPLMYEDKELQLAPEWLATEETYLRHVLRPYCGRTLKGTEAVERHRHNALQTHKYYKKHVTAQKLAWITRQQIFPEAVRRVCANFNHKPGDFLHERTFVVDPNVQPVRSPLDFWRTLGLAIRHYHCWLYVNGEQSYFTPRRTLLKARS
jgi:hypothetical protein